ncbi:hypothetical protein [Amycolatopsis thermoflava]|uniref:hypothetical protein n=1 Tax=Amycolatopsis thermoflava TaxID=84480 RepID=UPI0003FA911B|nr:hypothetical protein [Amycolatopsis thermoflava]
MRDPASLNVELTIVGMDRHEAAAILNALPADRDTHIAATQPALGGPRYKATIHGLSIAQAHDVAGALKSHTEAVWNSRYEPAKYLTAPTEETPNG